MKMEWWSSGKHKKGKRRSAPFQVISSDFRVRENLKDVDDVRAAVILWHFKLKRFNILNQRERTLMFPFRPPTLFLTRCRHCTILRPLSHHEKLKCEQMKKRKKGKLFSRRDVEKKMSRAIYIIHSSCRLGSLYKEQAEKDLSALQLSLRFLCSLFYALSGGRNYQS